MRGEAQTADKRAFSPGGGGENDPDHPSEKRESLTRNMEKASGLKKTPLPMWGEAEGEAEGEADYFFFVSGVRCQILSLYSLMVRSEENTPLLATLMISLRVHAFWSR